MLVALMGVLRRNTDLERKLIVDGGSAEDRCCPVLVIVSLSHYHLFTFLRL